MTSFVHVNQPAQHPGVARAEAVIDQLHTVRKRVDGARGLAALLLAAVVSAMLVVADRVVVHLTDGGLMVAWLVLWVLAFVAMALFADTTRALAVRAIAGWKQGAARRRAARADEMLLATAERDPRVMADLRAAITRQEAADEAAAKPASTTVALTPATEIPTVYETMRRVRIAYYY